MKLAIEPKDVDLIVESHTYSISDIEKMSQIIKHYKKTGELLQLDASNKSKRTKKETLSKA